MRVTVTRGGLPPDATAADGLPDTDTEKAIRNNAKLLWRACQEKTAGSGTPFTRNSRPGRIVMMNVSQTMGHMWDAYDPNPRAATSVAARTALYKYLREAGNMVCTERRSGTSTWWISSEWADRPHREPAGQPVETRFQCKYPDCNDDRHFMSMGLARHVNSIHGITFPNYMKVISGEMGWPEALAAASAKIQSPKVVTTANVPAARHITEATAPAARSETKATEATDPVEAVQALLAEVTRLRGIVGDSDLASENAYLREQLATTLERNAKLRQRLEAADRVLGRRS